MKEYLANLQNISEQTEEEQVTQFVRTDVKAVLENNEDAPQISKLYPRWPLTPKRLRIIRSWEMCLKNMSGVRSPNFSNLPKEIAEIVQREIEAG